VVLRIPASVDEWTLLIVPKLYLRPGDTVNFRENGGRGSYPDKNFLDCGSKTMNFRSPPLTGGGRC